MARLRPEDDLNYLIQRINILGGNGNSASRSQPERDDIAYLTQKVDLKLGRDSGRASQSRYDRIEVSDLPPERLSPSQQLEGEIKLFYRQRSQEARTVEEVLWYTYLERQLTPGFIHSNGLSHYSANDVITSMENSYARSIDLRTEAGLARTLRERLRRHRDPNQIYMVVSQVVEQGRDFGYSNYRLLAKFPQGQPRHNDPSEIEPGTIIYMRPSTGCMINGISNALESSAGRAIRSILSFNFSPDAPFSVPNRSREYFQKQAFGSRRGNDISNGRQRHTEEWDVGWNDKRAYLAWLAMGAVTNEQDRFWINDVR